MSRQLPMGDLTVKDRGDLGLDFHNRMKGSKKLLFITQGGELGLLKHLKRKYPDGSNSTDVANGLRHMDKSAVNLNPFDAWESASQNPVIGTAKSIGSYMPYASGVIGAGDALNNLYRGNYATAGVNAIQALAGFMPGRSGKGLAARLGSKGRLGAMAAKAVPYIAPLAVEHSTMYHHIGSMIPHVAAQTFDQSRQMNRPGYQKQMQEQERMMNDFQEWRHHRKSVV